MHNPITPEELKDIAFNASLNKYETIIRELKTNASKGNSSIKVEELPEVVQLKLLEEGYSVKPYVTYKYDYLLRKKRKKYYVVSF
ncbi:hypothetical protein [Myroides sp. N17-2]|uniref:hypothetical protein n=1 Tax=Myroides sp. N17-2 TaxID=2030799 RepID=UPI000EFAACCF|nr:hypothetical protein [Myroides sp. N17-2]